MPKGLIFFCCACCILILTIINLSIGPIISGKTNITGTENCAKKKDDYDRAKKNNNQMEKEVKKYTYEWKIDRCEREKAMYNMEYTAFIFDVVIGFVCGLLGLLHYLQLKKEFVEKTGLIGLICGGVGFILTFVYVVLNGLVYTSYYDNDSIKKTNGDGAFAEMKQEGKYECLYFDKVENIYAYIAKYSDLNKKQYNYNKDLKESFTKDPSVRYCTGYFYSNCNTDGYIEITGGIKYIDDNGESKDCKYLYLNQLTDDITNKDKSDRFLTALILSLFVCLAHIGLAIFGFLMAKTGDFE